MTKEEIIPVVEKVYLAFTRYCDAIPETTFFNKPGSKWSVAENVQHIITATDTSTLAYSLPKFLVRWVAGKPNRQSRTYEELVARYKKKLAEGGTASGRFVPKPFTIKPGKEKLMHKWNKAAIKHLTALKKYDDAALDNYLVKHPLLGRIALRELCYFSIYHTQHHLNNIASLAGLPQ